MSDELAHYIFLPYLQRGIAQYIANTDEIGQSPQGYRTGLTVSLTVDGYDPISKDIQFFSPGDVIGLDKRMIIRTDPTYKAVVSDYEPNFTPMVEFSQVDLPWCMTPAVSAGRDSGETTVYDRLRPWICLIVLKASDAQHATEEGEEVVAEFEELPATQNQPLPAIKVNLVNHKLPLPDIADSWAWAHVQVNTKDNRLESNDIESILAYSPHVVTSRLICPRRLEQGVLYNAFIVPTFRSGVLAGLGQLTSENDLSLLDFAWDANIDDPPELILPYYFKWEFRTGARGDFEYLVRLLEPRVIDKRVGIRHINCRNPGYQLNALNIEKLPDDDPLKHSLGLEGALRSLQTETIEWPTNDNDPFQDELQILLNLGKEWTLNINPEPHDNLLILPPLYGAWHDARTEVNLNVLVSSTEEEPVPTREWFRDLNLDPRHRATAGFGTLVVQDQQEALMASAWEQVGSVLEANQRLRQAQLAVEVNDKLYNNELSQLSIGNFLFLTSKMQSRILVDNGIIETASPMTISHLFRTSSQIPLSCLTPAFRRISRPLGPLRSTQKDDEDQNRASMIERLNEGEIIPAGPPPDPHGIINLNDLSEATKPPGARIIELFGLKLRWLLLLIIAIFAIGLFVLIFVYQIITGLTGFELIIPYIVIAIVILIVILRRLLPLYFRTVLSKKMTPEYITAETLQNITIKPNTVIQAPSFAIPGEDNPLEGLDPQLFKDYAIAACTIFLDRGLTTIVPFEPLILQDVKQVVLNSLRPRDIISARLRSQFRFAQNITPDLRPIKIGPEFPQPMYEPLRDLSHEYLLPGLEFIPQNTIGLLETNRKFIESYMVGLNSEMARELLWREYPSPLDATYFKQFWDVSGYVPTEVVEREINAIVDAKYSHLSEEEQANISSYEKSVEFDKELKKKLKDINDLHDWYKFDRRKNIWVSSKLGQNPRIPEGHIPTTEDPEEERKLVLLIRGDLLKKYPTALIYAVKGLWKVAEEGDTYICEYKNTPYKRVPDFSFSNEVNTKTPIFRGTLPPEITFLGFDLTEEVARGQTNIVTDRGGEINIPENNPGWYFVIEERVGETRFGIDEPLPEEAGANGQDEDEDEEASPWDDLTWDNIILSNSGYIVDENLDDGSFEPKWDSNSAIRAKIVLQKPIRVATHADDMMPKEETE